MKTKKQPHKRRTGQHQRRTKHFQKVYWPYIPMVVMILASIFISITKPASSGTLAYSTEMSIAGLLQETNNQRIINGIGNVAVNSLLISAAQAKANDMVARNYWSHTTPDGLDPWVFIENSGYRYTKAGENLAYGFLTSGEAVTGWMNSPSHRANMLDGEYTEVGFGFANSVNFNNGGEQTVVVAMYAKPLQIATTTGNTQNTTQATPAPAPTTQPAQSQAAPTQQSPASKQSSPTQQPSLTAPQPSEQPTPEPSALDTTNQNQSTIPSNSSNKLMAYESPQAISRIQMMTGGNESWSLMGVAIISGSAALLMLLKHGLSLRRLLRDSERFVLHHPLFDGTMIGIIILGITLARTAGTIL